MEFNMFALGIMMVFALAFFFGSGLTYVILEYVVSDEPVTLTCTTEIPKITHPPHGQLDFIGEKHV